MLIFVLVTSDCSCW